MLFRRLLWFTVSYPRKSAACRHSPATAGRRLVHLRFVFAFIRVHSRSFLRSLCSSAFARPTARQVLQLFLISPFSHLSFAICHLSSVMRFALAVDHALRLIRVTL